MLTQYTDDQNHLRVEVRSKKFEVPTDERARIQQRLREVGDRVHDLPSAQLWLTFIHHPRSQDYHAEAKLKLPGRTLFVGDRNDYLDSALQGCVQKLLAQIDA